MHAPGNQRLVLQVVLIRCLGSVPAARSRQTITARPGGGPMNPSGSGRFPGSDVTHFVRDHAHHLTLLRRCLPVSLFRRHSSGLPGYSDEKLDFPNFSAALRPFLRLRRPRLRIGQRPLSGKIVMPVWVGHHWNNRSPHRHNPRPGWTAMSRPSHEGPAVRLCLPQDTHSPSARARSPTSERKTGRRVTF
ncbi:hypothetical protein C8Q73DRAFT_299782 [Cubamyces lactineus]|nr:hypothetical protein C8Q73DRAFT_299782 [Cubamyces lactineus]